SGEAVELQTDPNHPATFRLSTTQPSMVRLSTTQPGQELSLEFAASPQARTEAVYNLVDATTNQQIDEALIHARLMLDHEAGKADETYMGVGVDSPDATLRAQLSLPTGAGLVVSYLDDQGPANSAVQLHDVLQKLDDQLLINSEQLVA